MPKTMLHFNTTQGGERAAFSWCNMPSKVMMIYDVRLLSSDT